MAQEHIFEVNLVTALPLLQMLLAVRGFEEPDIPFRDGWDVFKNFLSAPCASAESPGTVQVRSFEGEPTDFEVYFGREVTGSRNGFDATRLVGLHYLLQSPNSAPVEEEYWSGEYSSLDAFVSAVEASAGFQLALESVELASTFRLQEETDEFGVL